MDDLAAKKPEILAYILSHLPQRMLLVTCTRVCRTWNILLTQAPACKHGPNSEKNTQYLSEKDRALHAAMHITETELFLHPATNPAHDPSIMPYDNAILGAWAFPLLFGSPLIEHPTEFNTLPLYSQPGKWHSFMRAGASWRRMLTSQSPVYVMGVWLQLQGPQRDQHLFWKESFLPRRDAAADEERCPGVSAALPGMRMGDLYDRVVGLFQAPWKASKADVYWGNHWDKDPRTWSGRRMREDEQRRLAGMQPEVDIVLRVLVEVADVHLDGACRVVGWVPVEDGSAWVDGTRPCGTDINKGAGVLSWFAKWFVYHGHGLQERSE